MLLSKQEEITNLKLNKMIDASENIYSVEQFDFEFSKVSNLILHSYTEIIKNEKIEYTKLEDKKYRVILPNGKEKPEEYIRNVFLDKKYMRNKKLKREFDVSDLEFLPETGEIKNRQIIGYHDFRVSGLGRKILSEADEDIYFSIECKRLNNAKQSPEKYVNEGIIRYTTGKYSDFMPIAGMIAFIEDKHFDYSNEIDKILKKHKSIQTVQFFTQSKVSNDIYKSKHLKNKNKHQISINHFLFDFSTIIIKVA